jgi:hypothetical protein
MLCAIVYTTITTAAGANMNLDKLLENLTTAELNALTHKLLERAFAQMSASGDLQNADDVAEHMEDYYTNFVK